MAKQRVFPSLKILKEQFGSRHFALIPASYSQQQLDALGKASMAVLGMDRKVLASLRYLINPADEQTDVGVFFRAGENGRDNKCIMQIHPSCLTNYDWVKAMSDVRFRTWMHLALSLYFSSSEMASQVILLMQQEKADLYALFFPNGQVQEFILRIVLYFKTPKNKGKLARGHYDIGAVTLGLGECGPSGVAMGAGDDDLQLYPHESGWSTVMKGGALRQYMGNDPNGIWVPTWHEVREDDNSVVTDWLEESLVSRIGFALFCDFPGIQRMSVGQHVPYSYRANKKPPILGG